jgi:hypothetical protein
MSGVAIARYLLANSAALIANVSAENIKPGDISVNTTYPAISLREISGNELTQIKRGSNMLVTERIQITVYASTYPTLKAIIALIRAALPGQRGTVNTFNVDSLTYANDGPYLYSDDPITHEQSVDYFVRFVR